MHPWSDREWVTLQLGPAWVVSALLGRDRFAEPEKAALWHAVEALMTEATLAGELSRAALLNRGWLLDELLLRDRPVATGLSEVSALLDRRPAEVGRDTRKAMLTVGLDFGRARGPFGQVSRADVGTLQLVALLLESTADVVSQNPMNEVAPV